MGETESQGERLVQLMSIFFNRVSADLAPEDELELTLHELRALGALSRIGPTKMSPFACALGLHVSTVTRAVDRLAKKGLVERTNADDDRRCVVVTLSERGEARERCLLRQRAARADELLAALDSDERARLLASLEQLVPACKKADLDSDANESDVFISPEPR